MGFEMCHPAVNLLFFAAVTVGALAFDHPVFLLISLAAAAAYSIRRNGKRAALFDLGLLPWVAVFALGYGCFHHFGMTVLGQNAIGNRLTLEALVYGGVLGAMAAAFVMWMSCVYSVFSSDKVMYLFGRLSPRLSLFLAVILRMVPRLKAEARRIHTARCAIGRGIHQGSALGRMKNGLRIFSMLISWSIAALGAASDSMRSRGSGLRGRTAFSLYRFDGRDRGFVVALWGCVTLTALAAYTGWTDMVYAPRMLWRPMTVASCCFAVGYGALCLMPLALELYNALRFRRARRKLYALQK